jgi:hypothetical protein
MQKLSLSPPGAYSENQSNYDEFLSSLKKDRFDEIDERLKRINEENDSLLTTGDDLNDKELAEAKESGLLLEHPDYKSKLLGAIEAKISERLFSAAAAADLPPDAALKDGFLLMEIRKKTVPELTESEKLRRNVVSHIDTRIVNSEKAQNLRFILRQRMYDFIERHKKEYLEEKEKCDAQIRLAAITGIAVVGTVVVCTAAVQIGLTALLTQLFTQGQIAFVWVQGTLLPWLEAMFPLNLTELRVIMANFQKFNPNHIGEVVRQLMGTGKSVSEAIMGLDQMAITGFNKIAWADTAYSSSEILAELLNFKTYILNNFMTTAQFTQLFDKVGTIPAGLEKAGKFLWAKDFMSAGSEVMQLYTNVAPALENYISKFKFSFKLAEVILKFASEGDANEFYRFVIEAPFNVYLNSEYTRTTVLNSTVRFLEFDEYANKRIIELLAFSKQYVRIPFSDQFAKRQTKRVKEVGEWVYSIAIEQPSEAALYSVGHILGEGWEESCRKAITLKDENWMRRLIAMGMMNQLFNSGKQTLTLATNTFIGEKKAYVAPPPLPGDDGTDPEDDRRKALLKQGLFGKELEDIIDVEFGKIEDLAPDAALIDGVAFELRKFYRTLYSNFFDKGKKGKPKAALFGIDVPGYKTVFVEGTQANLLGFIFSATAGTLVFSNFLITPKMQKGENLGGNILFVLEPLLNFISDYIIEQKIKKLLTPELIKTTEAVEKLLVGLFNRIKNSCRNFKVGLFQGLNSIKEKRGLIIGLFSDIFITLYTITELLGSVFWDFVIKSNIQSLSVYLNSRAVNIGVIYRYFTDNIFETLSLANRFFSPEKKLTPVTALEFAQQLMNSHLIDIVESPVENVYKDDDKNCVDTLTGIGRMITEGIDFVARLIVWQGKDKNNKPMKCYTHAGAVVTLNNIVVTVEGEEGAALGKASSTRETYLRLLAIAESMPEVNGRKRTVRELLDDPDIEGIFELLNVSYHKGCRKITDTLAKATCQAQLLLQQTAGSAGSHDLGAIPPSHFNDDELYAFAEAKEGLHIMETYEKGLALNLLDELIPYKDAEGKPMFGTDRLTVLSKITGITDPATLSELLAAISGDKYQDKSLAQICELLKISPIPSFSSIENTIITGLLPPEALSVIQGNVIMETNRYISSILFGDILDQFLDKTNKKIPKSFEFGNGVENIMIGFNLVDISGSGVKVLDIYDAIDLGVIDSYGSSSTDPYKQRLITLFGRGGSLRPALEDATRMGNKIYIGKNTPEARDILDRFRTEQGPWPVLENVARLESELLEYMKTQIATNSHVTLLDRYRVADYRQIAGFFKDKYRKFMKTFVEPSGRTLFYNSYTESGSVTTQEVLSAANYAKHLEEYKEWALSDIVSLLDNNPALRTTLVAHMRNTQFVEHNRDRTRNIINFNYEANLPAAFDTLNLGAISGMDEQMATVFGDFGAEMNAIIQNDAQLQKYYKAESPQRKDPAYYRRVLELLYLNGKEEDLRSSLIFLNLAFTALGPNTEFLDIWKNNNHKRTDLLPAAKAIDQNDPNNIKNKENNLTGFLKRFREWVVLDSILTIDGNRLPFLIHNPFLASEAELIDVEDSVNYIYFMLFNKDKQDPEARKGWLWTVPAETPVENPLCGETCVEIQENRIAPTGEPVGLPGPNPKPLTLPESTDQEFYGKDFFNISQDSINLLKSDISSGGLGIAFQNYIDCIDGKFQPLRGSNKEGEGHKSHLIKGPEIRAMIRECLFNKTAEGKQVGYRNAKGGSDAGKISDWVGSSNSELADDFPNLIIEANLQEIVSSETSTQAAKDYAQARLNLLRAQEALIDNNDILKSAEEAEADAKKAKDEAQEAYDAAKAKLVSEGKPDEEPKGANSNLQDAIGRLESKEAARIAAQTEVARLTELIGVFSESIRKGRDPGGIWATLVDPPLNGELLALNANFASENLEIKRYKKLRKDIKAGDKSGISKLLPGLSSTSPDYLIEASIAAAETKALNKMAKYMRTVLKRIETKTVDNTYLKRRIREIGSVISSLDALESVLESAVSDAKRQVYNPINSGPNMDSMAFSQKLTAALETLADIVRTLPGALSEGKRINGNSRNAKIISIGQIVVEGMRSLHELEEGDLANLLNDMGKYDSKTNQNNSSYSQLISAAEDISEQGRALVENLIRKFNALKDDPLLTTEEKALINGALDTLTRMKDSFSFEKPDKLDSREEALSKIRIHFENTAFRMANLNFASIAQRLQDIAPTKYGKRATHNDSGLLTQIMEEIQKRRTGILVALAAAQKTDKEMNIVDSVYRGWQSGNKEIDWKNEPNRGLETAVRMKMAREKLAKLGITDFTNEGNKARLIKEMNEIVLTANALQYIAQLQWLISESYKVEDLEKQLKTKVNDTFWSKIVKLWNADYSVLGLHSYNANDDTPGWTPPDITPSEPSAETGFSAGILWENVDKPNEETALPNAVTHEGDAQEEKEGEKSEEKEDEAQKQGQQQKLEQSLKEQLSESLRQINALAQSLMSALAQALSLLIGNKFAHGGTENSNMNANGLIGLFNLDEDLDPIEDKTHAKESYKDTCYKIRDKYEIEGSTIKWISPDPKPEDFDIMSCVLEANAPSIVKTVQSYILSVATTVYENLLILICTPFDTWTGTLTCNISLNLLIGQSILKSLKTQIDRLTARVKSWKDSMGTPESEPFDAVKYFSGKNASMQDICDFFVLTIMLYTDAVGGSLKAASGRGYIISWFIGAPEADLTNLKTQLYGTNNKEYNIKGLYKIGGGIDTIGRGLSRGKTATQAAAIMEHTGAPPLFKKLLTEILSFIIPQSFIDILCKTPIVKNMISCPWQKKANYWIDLLDMLIDIVLGDFTLPDPYATAHYGPEAKSPENRDINPWRVIANYLKEKIRTNPNIKHEFVAALSASFFVHIFEDLATAISEFLNGNMMVEVDLEFIKPDEKQVTQEKVAGIISVSKIKDSRKPPINGKFRLKNLKSVTGQDVIDAFRTNAESKIVKGAYALENFSLVLKCGSKTTLIDKTKVVPKNIWVSAVGSGCSLLLSAADFVDTPPKPLPYVIRFSKSALTNFDKMSERLEWPWAWIRFNPWQDWTRNWHFYVRDHPDPKKKGLRIPISPTGSGLYNNDIQVDVSGSAVRDENAFVSAFPNRAISLGKTSEAEKGQGAGSLWAHVNRFFDPEGEFFLAYGLKFDTDRLPPVLDSSVETGGGEAWTKLKKHYKKVFAPKGFFNSQANNALIKTDYVYVLKRDIEISDATNMGINTGPSGGKRNWENMVVEIVFTHSLSSTVGRNLGPYHWRNDYEAISKNYGVHRDKLAIILSSADIHPFVAIQHGEVVFFVDYGNAGAPNLDPNSADKQSKNWLWEDGIFGAFGKIGAGGIQMVKNLGKGIYRAGSAVVKGVRDVGAVVGRAVAPAVKVVAEAAGAVAKGVADAGQAVVGRVANGIRGLLGIPNPPAKPVEPPSSEPQEPPKDSWWKKYNPFR